MTMKNHQKQFYWGSATSSHQVEGGTHNDWSEWEKANAGRLADDSCYKWNRWQAETFPEMADPKNYISAQACDHYHRYEEDFDLAREGGHNAHRFSVEWSRVEPEEGKFDERELEHYRNVVRALRARGLEPFVTLWHWTLPVWLSTRGGLLARDFPKYFSRYAERVMEVLQEDALFVMTFNEPNSVVFNGYITGQWTPEKKNIFLAWRAYRNLAKAHTMAYEALKEKYPKLSVGCTEIFTLFLARNEKSSLDRWAVRLAWKWGNERFLSRVSGSYDFLGVQNYFSKRVGVFGSQEGQEEGNVQKSDLGWDLHPDGLEKILTVCMRYGVPLYVTEDGLADSDDTRRRTYIENRIAGMQKAMANGADVRGYFVWSLLDNFEWDKGFWPRFGLVEVDRETLARKPRKSFWRYKEIISSIAERGK